MPKTILGTKNTNTQLYSCGRELTIEQIYASTLFPIVSVMEKNEVVKEIRKYIKEALKKI